MCPCASSSVSGPNEADTKSSVSQVSLASKSSDLVSTHLKSSYSNEYSHRPSDHRRRRFAAEAEEVEQRAFDAVVVAFKPPRRPDLPIFTDAVKKSGPSRLRTRAQRVATEDALQRHLVISKLNRTPSSSRIARARDVASSQEKLEDVELFPSLPPLTLPSPVHFTYRSFTLCLSLGGGVV